MYKDIVVKILTIIDYPHDREAFLVDFDRVVSSQAVIDLVKSLPEDKRSDAEDAISKAQSQEEFSKAISAYFTVDQVSEAIDAAAAPAISQWISSIAPTLTDEQKQKLIELSSEMEKNMGK